jgi:hypothetical protein
MIAHIDALVDDYTLELLPVEVRRSVERHVAGCERCRELLVAEGQRTAELVVALDRVLAPRAGRLQAMWPAVAAAARVGPSHAASRPAAGWWLRWRVAFAAFAIGVFLLGGLLSSQLGLPRWLMETNTPTATAQTASPTASTTPTWSRPSYTVESVAFVGSSEGPSAGREFEWEATATATPEPVTSNELPVPQPNPSAPAADGR